MLISCENLYTKYLDASFSNMIKMIDNCYKINRNYNWDIKECWLVGELLKITRMWLLWRQNMELIPKYDFSLMYATSTNQICHVEQQYYVQ